MTTSHAMRPVAIGELVAAWYAVQRGEFQLAGGRELPATTAVTASWTPAAGDIPVLVAGCMGSTGVSTVALLLATSAGPARVVECAAGTVSGLAGAATAELGPSTDGWLQGSRGLVTIQRRRDKFTAVDQVPPPPESDNAGLTVVDCPWELTQVLASNSWLGQLAAGCARVVLVTRATMPGLRRLENYLTLLGVNRCRVVVVGGPRRWPRTLANALGPAARQISVEGRLFTVPEDPGLARDGITTDDLPAGFLPVGRELLKGLLP